MRTTIKFVLTIIVLILVSILVGALESNRFIALGLAIVIIASLVTLAAAASSGVKAWQAAKKKYDVPDAPGQGSSFIKFPANIGGIDNHDPLAQIRRSIEELKNVATQDERNWRKQITMINYRIDLCLKRLDHHEEVTLPKLIGESSGTIIISAILAIIGSAYLAFPNEIYVTFNTMAALIKLAIE